MAGVTLREETRSSALRYSNTAWSQHGAPSLGMARDPAPYEVPEGYCYDAVDFLCDEKGKLRKRGGWTTPNTTNRTAVSEFISGYRSADIDGLSRLVYSLGKGGASIGYLDRTTVATNQITADAGNDTIAAKPFQYQNLMLIPFVSQGNSASDFNLIDIYGGASVSATSFPTLTAATVTAGDNLVTGLAGGTFTANHVGELIALINTGSSTIYIGRIVQFVSGSSVRVSPTPRTSFTANSGISYRHWRPTLLSQFATTGQVAVSGRYGVAYQGRAVLANCARVAATFDPPAANSGAEHFPFRVWWSNEQADPISSGVFTHEDGDGALYPNFFGQFDYVDVPEVGPSGITGLAVAGEGDLVVFGSKSTHRITGSLTTETVLNPVFSFTVQEVSANVGCIEARSIQYTRQGLVFCGAENIFLFDGAQMKPLLTDTNENYYQARLAAGDKILGSAWLGNQNHYYLSMTGTDGGLLFNMDGLEMTRVMNTSLMDSARDPDDPTKVWGLKRWDTTGAAPTFVAGPLMQLDSMFRPTSANVADGDSTNVLAAAITKPYADIGLENVNRYRQLKMGYDLRYGAGAATATVSADTTLSPPDASYTTITSTLPETTVPGIIGFQVGPLLKKGQALLVRVAMNGPADRFEILSFAIACQPLRQGRSA